MSCNKIADLENARFKANYLLSSETCYDEQLVWILCRIADVPLLVSYSSTNWTRLQKPMVEVEMTLEVPVTVAQPDPNEDGPHEV